MSPETLNAAPAPASATSAVPAPASEIHAREGGRGERFQFGGNWRRFLAVLDERRITEAEDSLRRMLDLDSLAGLSFLDVGSGSGLFSLAARRLGARVHSLDYDPESVACTVELRRRYYPDDEHWVVEQGSALDATYLDSLGRFDVVYSWGVLHHTGRMWQALDFVHRLVAPGGRLFIAIYNDMGTQSVRWRWIKRTYNRLPRPLRLPYTVLVAAPGQLRRAAGALLRRRPGQYLRSWFECSARGMSRWHDLVDWVGGYPYEVARPEEIVDFYLSRGFALRRLKCGGVGLGCNEFVFRKEARPAQGAAAASSRLATPTLEDPNGA